MKRTVTPLLVLIVIACAMTLTCSRSFAQASTDDGAHGHSGIEDNAASIAGHETRLDGHDTAIEAVKNAGAAADAAQDARLDAIEARLDALEEGGSSGGGGTDPDPLTMVLVFVDIDAKTKTPMTEATLSLVDPPAFTICAESSDPAQQLAGPVDFGGSGTKTENIAEFCRWGGDGFIGATYTPSPWGPGEYTLTAKDRASGLEASVAITISERDPGGGGGGQHTDVRPPVLPDTGDRPIMQLGMWSWITNNLENPFTDLMKLSGGWEARGQNGAYMSFAEMWTAGYIDRDTLLPNAIPPGMDYVYSGTFRFGARFYPDYFAGDYALEWEGDATVSFGFGHRAVVNDGPTRKIGSFAASDKGWMRVEITRIGAEGLKAVRLFRVGDDPAETWDAAWLDHACRYDVLRGMDVTYPMKSSVRSVDMMTPASANGWGRGGTLKYEAPDAPLGPPILPQFDLAATCDSALWYNVAGPIGAPESFDAFSFDGQPKDENGNRKQPVGEEIRVAARESAKLIAASPEWDRYADALVAALDESGYDPETLFIIEIGNELWNYAHPFWWTTNYYAGFGEGNGPIPGGMLNYSFGQGYAAGRMAHAFHHALERAGREQNWTMAIGAQTAWDMTSRSALNAFGKYFRDRDIDPAPWYAKAGVATTSYYANALGEKGILPKRADESHDQWAARWLAAIRADPDGMAQKATDWFFQDIDQDATFHWIKQRRAQHRASAEAVGAYLLGDYEGGSHESHGVISKLRTEPDFVNWLERWRYGEHGERLTAAWIEEMYADDPDAIVANFMSIGAVDPEGDSADDRDVEAPWVDNFYGEENGFTRAMEPFLRPVN